MKVKATQIKESTGDTVISSLAAIDIQSARDGYHKDCLGRVYAINFVSHNHAIAYGITAKCAKCNKEMHLDLGPEAKWPQIVQINTQIIETDDLEDIYTIRQRTNLNSSICYTATDKLDTKKKLKYYGFDVWEEIK